jgi:hypothetical protein
MWAFGLLLDSFDQLKRHFSAAQDDLWQALTEVAQESGSLSSDQVSIL